MFNVVTSKKKISIILLAVNFLISTKQVSFAQKNYFYTNKPYGSEALLNPVSVFLNGGFDILQLNGNGKSVNELQYSRRFNVLMKNLKSPFQNISHYGTKSFFYDEVFPTSLNPDHMQWATNYFLHLFGGGMLYTAMKEWYQQNNFPVPHLLSAITIMSQHVFNEVLESELNDRPSVDEIADIYIFDIGGILLFSFDSVNEFFSKELNLADWSKQATIIWTNKKINAGQYFSMKWKLPFSERVSLFYRFGMETQIGLSDKINSEDNLSLGVGFRSKNLVPIGNLSRKNTIDMDWSAGIFYDRNNSLMASLVMSGVKEYFCMADIYPGILKIGDFSPGIWAIISRNGNLTYGITTRYVLGIGHEGYY